MSELPEINQLWDYSDPAASEQRLRAALEQAERDGDRAYAAELRTQVARTYSLRRQFDAAHALLDEVDSVLDASMLRARMRSLLERGRTYNSQRERDRARVIFAEAWQVARAAKLDGLAVDAAHMLGIVCEGDDAAQWNEQALALAESSNDPDAQRWRGSLHNNIGWHQHSAGDFDQALQHFHAALQAREQDGDARDVRMARWCVARCLRLLNRLDEALAMQMRLLEQCTQDNAPDGFVYEEFAECLQALDRADEAQPHFQRAYELLSADAYLVESEPKRLERLRTLGQLRDA